MAVTNNQTFKVAYVATQTQYNNITTKDSGTLYWVAGAKKVYLDGIAYGFDESDITASRLAALIVGSGGGEANTSETAMEVRVTNADGHLVITALPRIASSDLDTANLLTVVGGDERGQGGLVVKASAVQSLIDASILDKVTNKLAQANGIATLDGAGKVPAAQLPSYVDDVLEFANQAAFPTTGTAGVIYVAIDSNKVYRWSGTAYVEISSSLALGETSGTAYRGDRGKAAYDHAQIVTGNPHGTTKADVGLGNVQNYGLATQAEAEAGSSAVKYMTPLQTKQAISKLAPVLTWTVIQ